MDTTPHNPEILHRALEDSKAALLKHLEERERIERQISDEVKRHDRRLTEIILKSIDPALRETMKLEGEDFIKQHVETVKLRNGIRWRDVPVPMPPPPPREKLTFRVLPFDDQFVSKSGSANGFADKGAGTFGFGMSGNAAVNVGVAVGFQPTVETQALRVAAYTEFHVDWLTASTFYVAHNRGSLGFFIWETDPAGNSRVILDQGTPLWMDGTSWLMTHSDDQDEIQATEGFFHAKVGHAYAVWLLARGSCDEDSGFGGSSFAQGNFNARVPFMTFGSI
jgi:hypothetical protein